MEMNYYNFPDELGMNFACFQKQRTSQANFENKMRRCILENYVNVEFNRI